MKSTSTLISIVILNVFLLFITTNQPMAQNHDISATNVSLTNNYYLKTAKMHLGLKDYTKAINSLELALLLEPNNTEARTLLKESRRLLEEKKTTHEAQDNAGVPKDKEIQISPDKGISSLLQTAYTAIEEGRYDDATRTTDLMLEIEPTNEDALYIKGKANAIQHKRITENLKTIHTQEKLKGYENVREAAIPYQEIYRFPAKEQWSDISKRILPELDKVVKENKRKTEQLRMIPNPARDITPKAIEDALSTIISFEFLDVPLKDIVIFIREKSNINMIVDADAGNISVTLKLKDVPLRTALKYLLPKGYEFVIEGDIIHIYRQKMELRVYDVRDILINLDDKEPLEFDITAAASAQIGMKKKEPIKTKAPSERIFDLIELIATTVEPVSWSFHTSVIGVSGTGGQRSIKLPGQGEGSIIARMGQPGDLVVVNTKYVHKQIEDLLASLRSSQNLQVSIEARFISVTDKFLEDIGNTFSKFFSDDTSIDTGAGNITGNLSGQDVSGLTVNYSLLSNSMLVGLLKAIQESKDSEILTSPRITLSNTQRGNIAVVKTINYIQSTSVSEGVVTPVIGTVPQGTTFDVRPIVSADRRYIYLEVAPSVFEVEEITSFTFSGVNTDVNIGGGGQGTTNIPPEQTVQLPTVNISQVSVTVCIPDKGTLMIGGLGAINKTHLVTGIPILSKIPVLKHLFTRDQKTNDKANLIILLKPTILIREEQEAKFLANSTR